MLPMSTLRNLRHSLKVNLLSSHTKKRFVKFRFHNIAKRNSKIEEAKIDSGAEANTITVRKYKDLYPERVDEKGSLDQRNIRKSHEKLEAYGGVEIPHLGTVNLPVEYAGKKFMRRFYLCDIEGSILLGLPTFEPLGIVKITINELSENVSVSAPETSTTSEKFSGRKGTFV